MTWRWRRRGQTTLGGGRRICCIRCTLLYRGLVFSGYLLWYVRIVSLFFPFPSLPLIRVKLQVLVTCTTFVCVPEYLLTPNPELLAFDFRGLNRFPPYSTPCFPPPPVALGLEGICSGRGNTVTVPALAGYVWLSGSVSASQVVHSFVSCDSATVAVTWTRKELCNDRSF
jgi:hypothetical protein